MKREFDWQDLNDWLKFSQGMTDHHILSLSPIAYTNLAVLFVEQQEVL